MTRLEIMTVLKNLDSDISTLKARLAEAETARAYFQRKLDDNMSSTHSTMTQSAAARAVLLLAGGPLSIREIVDRIHQGGFYPGDPNDNSFVASVSTAMARDEKTFKKVGRAKWDLWSRDHNTTSEGDGGDDDDSEFVGGPFGRDILDAEEREIEDIPF